jgi:hypothetical protein
MCRTSSIFLHKLRRLGLKIKNKFQTVRVLPTVWNDYNLIEQSYNSPFLFLTIGWSGFSKAAHCCGLVIR